MIDKRIVVYGAGYNAHEVIERLISEGKNIIAVVDSNPYLWGGKICDIEIEDFLEFSSQDKKSKIKGIFISSNERLSIFIFLS